MFHLFNTDLGGVRGMLFFLSMATRTKGTMVPVPWYGTVTSMYSQRHERDGRTIAGRTIAATPYTWTVTKACKRLSQ